MKLIIIKLKHTFIPFLICLFTICLIIYSTQNITAAKNGMKIWIYYVVPSMFPFFIATNLLLRTDIFLSLGKFFSKIMKPIFNVPGECFFPFIMGIISGYPIGAKIVCDFKRHGICTKSEAERLISYTNNSGPLFIIGTVGVSMFNNQKVGVLLFISHITASLFTGFLFSFWKKSNNNILTKNNKYTKHTNDVYHTEDQVNFYNIGEILSSSIKKSIESLLVIGGFIMLFSIIVSILEASNILYILSNFFKPVLNIFNISSSFSNGIIIGFVELTNGLKYICIPGNNTSIIICSFLLGIGGISIFMQILSIIYKAKISIYPYIIGKFLQACFSVVFMYFFLYVFKL